MGVAWTVERIAITHFHPDHVGGAEAAARATGAPVYQGGLDYAQCERVWGSDDWPERIAAWFVRHGVPVDVTDDLIVQGHAFASFIRYAIDPDLLYEGSEVGGWQVARASRPRGRPPRLPSRRRADRRRPPAAEDHAGGRALSGEPTGSARRLPRLARANDRARAAHRLSGPRRADPRRRRRARAS